MAVKTKNPKLSELPKRQYVNYNGEIYTAERVISIIQSGLYNPQQPLMTVSDSYIHRALQSASAAYKRGETVGDFCETDHDAVRVDIDVFPSPEVTENAVEITYTQAKIYEAYKRLGSQNAVYKELTINQDTVRRHLNHLKHKGLATSDPKHRGRFILMPIPFRIVPDPPPTETGPMDTGITISKAERDWMLTEYPDSIYQRSRRLAVAKLREMGFTRTKSEVNYMAMMLGVYKRG